MLLPMSVTDALATSSPMHALARLGRLRWGALLLALLVLAACAVAGVALPWLGVLQALLTLALVNGVLEWGARRGQPPQRLVRVGLLADVVVLSELLALTGGAANPMATLYLLPVLFAALLVPGGGFAWLLAGLAASLYGLLFFWHLPWPTAGGDAAYAFSLHLGGMWLTFAVSAFLLAGFVSRLAQQLAEERAALASAREALLRDEQLVALGVQAAAAAHALSTPLNTLTLLVDEWDPAAPAPEQAADLNVMRTQLATCRTALSRLKEGAETEARPADLHGLLQLRLAAWRALRPEVALETTLPAGEGPAVSVPPAFWPAFYNLLNNAAEAAGTSPVVVDAAWQAGWLTLDITNTHGSFDPARLARAGLTPLESSKPAGLGLGVLLTHATLSRLGGHLALVNRPEGGVVARVRLPLPERRQE